MVVERFQQVISQLFQQVSPEGRCRGSWTAAGRRHGGIVRGGSGSGSSRWSRFACTYASHAAATTTYELISIQNCL